MRELRTRFGVLVPLLALLWVGGGCSGDDDEFTADDDDDATSDDDDDATAGDDDDATPGDDDDATAGDDDDATAGDDDDDDTEVTDDDDDTTNYSGSIEGTVHVDGGITINASSPYGVAIGLYHDEDFNPMFGPTGEPVNGVEYTVPSFPTAYSVPIDVGEEVWVAVFLDDNENGLGSGADSGDIVGFSDSLVTASATGVDVTLAFVIP